MTAHVIPFPKKPDPNKTTLDSEEEMVAWAIWTHCVQSKRYSVEDAEEFGRTLWKCLQGRANASDIDAKRNELERAIREATIGWLWDSGETQQIRNFLRVRYHVASTNESPAASLDEAIDIVRTMGLAAWNFLGAMNDLRAAFMRQVFGGNEPWTPAVRRKLKRGVGERPDWRALAAELEQRVS